MIRIPKSSAPPVFTASKPTVGRWIVWDRDQTRIIAVGESFDAARQAAAVTGESSVILTRMVPGRDGLSEQPLYSVAVFISPTRATAAANTCGYTLNNAREAS